MAKKSRGHYTFKATKKFLIIIKVLSLVINNMADLASDPTQARGIISRVKDRDIGRQLPAAQDKTDKRIPSKHWQSDFLFPKRIYPFDLLWNV